VWRRAASKPSPRLRIKLGQGSGSGDKEFFGSIQRGRIFAKYDPAAGGYILKVPKGWPRTEKGD